jgi:hypothetical protein
MNELIRREALFVYVYGQAGGGAGTQIGAG